MPSSVFAGLPVQDDGVSIQESGVFTDGCYYGETESQSDHAPVIYGEFGTWNVAGPISHFAVKPDPNKPAIHFFNHKFFTNSDGSLIDREQKPLGFLGGSEVILLRTSYNAKKVDEMLYRGTGDARTRNTTRVSKMIDSAADSLVAQIEENEALSAYKDSSINFVRSMQAKAQEEINSEDESKFINTLELLNSSIRGYALPTEKYLQRMEIVVEKIKGMFKDNPALKYMVLQEVPKSFDKSAAGESLQDRITEMFKDSDPWYDSMMRVLNQSKLDDKGQAVVDRDRLRKFIGEAPANIKISNPNKFLNDLIFLKRSQLKGDKRAEAKLNALLSPDGEEKLNVVFFKQLPGAGGKLTTNISKTNYKKNLVPDVAFVYRSQKVYPYQMASDNDNRFVPWCFRDTKTCYVSSHMPFTATSDELIERCKDMRGMAE